MNDVIDRFEAARHQMAKNEEWALHEEDPVEISENKDNIVIRLNIPGNISSVKILPEDEYIILSGKDIKTRFISLNHKIEKDSASIKFYNNFAEITAQKGV